MQSYKDFNIDAYDLNNNITQKERVINLSAKNPTNLIKKKHIEQFYENLLNKYNLNVNDISIRAKDGTGAWMTLKTINDDELREYDDDYANDKVKDITKFKNAIQIQFKIYL